MILLEKKRLQEQLQSEKAKVLQDFEKQKKKLSNSNRPIDSVESFMERLPDSNSP